MAALSMRSFFGERICGTRWERRDFRKNGKESTMKECKEENELLAKNLWQIVFIFFWRNAGIIHGKLWKFYSLINLIKFFISVLSWKRIRNGMNQKIELMRTFFICDAQLKYSPMKRIQRMCSSTEYLSSWTK